MGRAGGLDVFEADGLSGVVRVDGGADRLVFVEDPDLGDVSLVFATVFAFRKEWKDAAIIAAVAALPFASFGFAAGMNKETLLYMT